MSAPLCPSIWKILTWVLSKIQYHFLFIVECVDNRVVICREIQAFYILKDGQTATTGNSNALGSSELGMNGGIPEEDGRKITFMSTNRARVQPSDK